MHCRGACPLKNNSSYRSFWFYYLVSLFLFSLLFLRPQSGAYIVFPSVWKESAEQIAKEKNISSRKHRYQLIEVLDEGDLPDLHREMFLGAKNQRGKNESPSKTLKQPGIRASNPPVNRNNSSSLSTSPSFLNELMRSKESQQGMSKGFAVMNPEILRELENSESRYFQGQSVRKLNIQMDKNGDFSVNVMSFPGAEYIISVSRSIFRYWLDFLPGQMIQMGFIKTDGLGSLQAILTFSSQGVDSDLYKVALLRPFNSKTLNEATLGAFSYYHMPMDKNIRIRSIGVEIQIYRDTLTVSANFEFQLWGTGKSAEHP